jgi:hypothetical protein
MFMPSESFIGNIPALCAASTIKQILCFLHNSASLPTGRIFPVTLLAAVQTIALVREFISFSKFRTVSSSLFVVRAME